MGSDPSASNSQKGVNLLTRGRRRRKQDCFRVGRGVRAKNTWVTGCGASFAIKRCIEIIICPRGMCIIRIVVSRWSELADKRHLHKASLKQWIIASQRLSTQNEGKWINFVERIELYSRNSAGLRVSVSERRKKRSRSKLKFNHARRTVVLKHHVI